jgi:hypothetical protein
MPQSFRNFDIQNLCRSSHLLRGLKMFVGPQFCWLFVLPEHAFLSYPRHQKRAFLCLIKMNSKLSRYVNLFVLLKLSFVPKNLLILILIFCRHGMLIGYAKPRCRCRKHIFPRLHAMSLRRAFCRIWKNSAIILYELKECRYTPDPA